MTKGMELPNQEKIRTLGEKKINKYLGILESETIKQVKMLEKIKKEKTTCDQIHQSWAVPLVRYSGPILKWAR